jgi:L-aspartate oxidase
MQFYEFDTVILGSGLAGLSATFYASKHGKVALVTKSQLDISNSFYAQGGIAAAIAPDDSPELHKADTLVAGRGLCDNNSVDLLVTEGRERVLELIDMGMPFDRKNGDLVLGLEGGHSKRRILHADGVATGKELTSFMLRKVLEMKSVHTFEFTAALALLHNGTKVWGVQVFDFQTSKNIILLTKAVIIATGGFSRIYLRSTNPQTATGDGIAMAWEAGAAIADIEFVQFHPSALYIPGEEAYLISEAVRGEGAWLLNHEKERFMLKAHPLAELAPRDIVAYNIFNQIRNSGKSNVFLSLKHLDAESIKSRFYHIYKHLKQFGLDLTSDLIPVAPAAHYMVGGIKTNLNAQTRIEGLFVCGEAASTGVMGANRLASNSLLECLVFGKRAAESAAKTGTPSGYDEKITPYTIDSEFEPKFLEIRNEISSLMNDCLGIVRNKINLEKALSRFENISLNFGDHNFKYNRLKIKNLATVCSLVAKAALMRTESRGGHIREDFPNENPDFRIHSIQQKGKELEFVPVR